MAAVIASLVAPHAITEDRPPGILVAAAEHGLSAVAVVRLVVAVVGQLVAAAVTPVAAVVVAAAAVVVTQVAADADNIIFACPVRKV